VPTPTYATAWAITPLTEREYRMFRSLVHREAGIELGPAKRELLIGRLSRRIRELGLTSFGEYYDYATGRGGTEELVHLLDHVATNETHFFREPGHFEFVERTCCPRWMAEADAGARTRTIRVWSAACSSGEEPYSIAMLLLAQLPLDAGWTVEVLATDLSTRVLRRAKEATWPVEKRREIPMAYLRRFMLRGVGTQTGLMKAGPALRAAVRFGRLNLMDEHYAVGLPFDLIFCRNVLIYFDARTKAQVVGRLSGHLAPGGHLFLGHAESVYGMQTDLETVGHTVYHLGRRAP
jgi:chemotaxis protein methyltransferase CheR